MPEPGAFADFHFLRPAWLLVLPAALLLGWALDRHGRAERQWRRIVAPHLLAHLRVETGKRWRLRPLHLLVAVLILGSFALAGPAWEREVSPLAEDNAPLVIALDVSTTMNAVDVQPTRLERAKQKIRDLQALRAGARSALLAYAGSAHVVLPLCDDPKVFESYLTALRSELMPLRGQDPSRALALAEELLADEPTPGSILFLTDGVPAEQVPVFAEHAARSDDEVLLLAVGTRRGGPIKSGESGWETDAGGRRIVATLDLKGLAALAAEAGVFVSGVTVDDADVGRLNRRVESHLREVQARNQKARYKDRGYWLVLPIALLTLLWFRKGWTVRWGGGTLLASLVASVWLAGCATPEEGGPRFADLWWTADQQGRRAFERGDFAGAAARFEDPVWRGAAHYRAGDFERAAEAFGRSATSEASFGMGNAQAMLGRYQEAAAAYDAALAERPGWTEAIANRDLVLALVEQRPEPPEDEPPQGDPSFDPDQIQFDERGEKGAHGEVERSHLDDEQLAEMWLRRLQSSPADFLRQRFAIEAATGDEGSER